MFLSRQVDTEGRPETVDGRRTTSWRTLTLMLAPALIAVILLFGGGLVLGLLQALEVWGGTTIHPPSLIHFVRVFRDPDFSYSLGLTLWIAGASTIIAAIIAVILALLIMRYSQSSRLLLFILQIPLTVPHLVIAIAILYLLSSSGLIARLCISMGIIDSAAAFPLLTNDRYGIGILTVYIWKEIPFICFMVLAVLKSTTAELFEAGATLGAGRIKRFLHITLPIIAPNLGAACLIVFAFTFGGFEVPYLLGQSHPLSLPVWAYRNYSDVDLIARPEGIAIGLIITVTVIGCVVLAQFLLSIGARTRAEGSVR